MDLQTVKRTIKGYLSLGLVILGLLGFVGVILALNYLDWWFRAWLFGHAFGWDNQ